MSIKNIFNARGERRARRLEAKLPDYDAHAKGNTALLTGIQDMLVKIKRTDLTPDQILNRATTQSCAGCHQLSPEQRPRTRSAGSSPGRPATALPQIDEKSKLSPALTELLPFRARVLAALADPTCQSAAASAGEDGAIALLVNLGKAVAAGQ